MDLWSARFNSKQDECEHLILGLLISDVYESQKHELVDIYGIDIVEEAYRVVVTDYSGLLERLI